DLSTDNLRLLSSRQALADLAHFRTVMGETRGLTNRKWVAFGGSYPGSLAAWFRLKYPHLVHASVATSAPVFATVNFPEYLEVVWRSLASENADCPVLVKKASDTLAERLKDPKTFENITKDFKYTERKSPATLGVWRDQFYKKTTAFPDPDKAHRPKRIIIIFLIKLVLST
ncbi:hypothetical protein XENORESO_015738, partial [Xenotaenia resolanae]